MALKIKAVNAGWFLAIVYLAGSLASILPQTIKFMPWLIRIAIPVTLITLLSFHKKWNRLFLFSILLIGGSGFLLDVLAVKTGYILGYFQYGPTLGLTLWDTPVILALYWISIIYCTRQIAEMMAGDAFAISVIASLFMVLLDYFAQPFAVRFGLWSWNGSVVPMHNYIGCFISGLLIHYVFLQSVKFTRNKLSLPVFLIQLGFFVGLFLLKK